MLNTDQGSFRPPKVFISLSLQAAQNCPPIPPCSPPWSGKLKLSPLKKAKQVAPCPYLQHCVNELQAKVNCKVLWLMDFFRVFPSLCTKLSQSLLPLHAYGLLKVLSILESKNLKTSEKMRRSLRKSEAIRRDRKKLEGIKR